MKYNIAPFFLIIFSSLSLVSSSKIEKILEEWTLEKLHHITTTLPYITGPKSPLKQTNLNLINIKTIPEKLNNIMYWNKIPDWSEIYSYEKIKLVLEKARSVLEQKQRYFPSQMYENQFFRKAYRFDQNDTIHVIGDLHGGGLHDIQIFLEDKVNQALKIFDKHNHFVFLGDMVDGGLYSLETLYLVTILFLKNKKNIHIIRGNHEDIDLNESYGFCRELMMKYKDFFSDNETLEFCIETLLQQYIKPFYAKLPVVLFGVFPNSQLIIPFCHGTLDLHDQRGAQQFLSSFLQNIKKEREYFEYFYTDSGISGYQWNDHTIYEYDKTNNSERDNFEGTLKVIGKEDTEKWLQNICPTGYHSPCIIRAHQHSSHMNDLMPLFFGHYFIAFLWNNNPLVFTLCVNPGSGFSLPRNNDNCDLCFPGILNSTTLTLSHSGKIINIIRHKNTHISKGIKQQHVTLLNEHIVLKGFVEEYYKALSEDFDVYLYYNNIDEQHATEEHFKAFLQLIVSVNQKETIATFCYDQKKKQIQLDLFYLPQTLINALKLTKDQVNTIHQKRRLTSPELPDITITRTDLVEKNQQKNPSQPEDVLVQPKNNVIKKIAYTCILLGICCFLCTQLQTNDLLIPLIKKALTFMLEQGSTLKKLFKEYCHHSSDPAV